MTWSIVARDAATGAFGVAVSTCAFAVGAPIDGEPACHANGGHSYKSIYGRLAWDRPAQTVTTGFERYRLPYNALTQTDLRSIDLRTDFLGRRLAAPVLIGAMTGGADPDVLAGCEVVVITAGAKQKPGQTRLDLGAHNVEILRGLLPQVQAHAPEALIVLVTNPVDVLTLVAQRLTGLPAGRVIGSGTLLDTSRLRWLLASRAQVHASSVHAAILGEHGDTEFPAWSSARIGPTPILEWPTPADPLFTRADLDEVADTVVHAAYEVIQGKGATTYAVGVATTRLLEAILRDQHAILPVSTVLDGVHGLSDVALSMPCIVSREGIEGVVPVPMSDGEITKLHASAERLKDSLSSLDI